MIQYIDLDWEILISHHGLFLVKRGFSVVCFLLAVFFHLFNGVKEIIFKRRVILS
jgi:succinate dehydrogenase/fumarate reductase cytochrome b subunit